MKYLKIFVSSIFAGLCIALGATVYLSMLAINQKFIGSLLFGVGLFTIISFGLWLYTGKIGFVVNEKINYLLKLVICFIGNIIGAITLPIINGLTRYKETLKQTALSLVETKQSDEWYSILILSILCGMLIYLAVKGQNVCKTNIGKTLIIFLAVSAFIMSGFEHVIANASYYAYAKVFDIKVVLYIILMMIGNSIGAIILEVLYKFITNKKDEE